jgi:integrase
VRKEKARKRGQNEGTIFEERPGRWVALVTLGYEVRDGKRRRIRKKFVAETRGVVQKKLTAALREQQTGGIVPIQRDSLGGLLDRFPGLLRAKGRAESTIASYEWLIRTYIKPEIGAIPLTHLTQVHLNDFMQRKIEAGLSPRTVQYCHAVIRSALTRAERDGLVGRNVAKLAEPPRQDHVTKIDPLSAEDARRLLGAVQGHRLEALYSVALAVGLRRGEALGLSWDAIDLYAATLAVTQTAQRVKGKGIILRQAAKTDKSLRMIPLPLFAVRKLQQHRETQERERKAAGEQWREHGLVFCSSIGTPIEPSNLLRHYHGVLKGLNIAQHRFHDLRHTAASLLLAQGATLHDVKEILGHSQIRLTSDLYGHAYMTVKRAAIDRIDAVLEPKPEPEQISVAPPVAPLQASETVH